MMFTVLLTKKARKELDRMQKDSRDRILFSLQQLRVNPFSGKKLDGEHEGFWAMRVWPYRIIYTIEKHLITVTVVAIGDRKDIYRRLHK